ncbi:MULTISPECIES: ATP-binding protein [Oleiagrimonas]|uniref:histidine kinase n=1 Tax=Oleiagrimonas citrea TaxID=1665687 RepID=A0A846ZP54_9GAMM|nr:MULTISPECIES: ATP-binding protein [Oleiagrimonas]NKZ39330.1 HAMP domain-containing protein [Oleiagrimonas citrea]RAP59690.1 histidine kinase [Oleiagrimonas sp. MCCC 1A03011]
MTLRRKLLLVALCTLVLPLVGLLYVRQMETLLRRGQAQALAASAHALARSLVVVGAALPKSSGWYVQRPVDAITVDGYGDDWGPMTPWAQPLGDRGRLMLAHDDAWLYLFASIRDTTRTRRDADAPDAMRADHVLLTLARGRLLCTYLIASAAPGGFSAPALNDCRDDGFPDHVNGQWQDDGSGYRIELRLPRSLGVNGLGLSVHDADAATADLTEPVRPLLSYSRSLSAELAQLAPDGVQARLLGPHAWLLATAGSLRTHEDPHRRPGWLAYTIYRLLIAAPFDAAQPWTQDAPRLDTPQVREALAGKEAISWTLGEQRGSVILSVTVPVRDAHGVLRGALQLDQASLAVPLLANRALFALLLASLGVLLAAGLVLFGFATRLSMRLGRLRDAAERAQARDGRHSGAFPSHDDTDELGDLARSFERLTQAVAGYTDYLRTLASKLSHELNTPLAIVKSSLDNLEHAGLPEHARPYLQRARDGVTRMGSLVRAMSEASRMERAIEAAEAETFDLREVVRGCAEGYRELAAPRRIELELPDAPVTLHGAPELIAQALDKLFGNAVSFTPEDGWIRLGLRVEGDEALLEMANQGPPLPASMQDRLFDSLVSVREDRGHEGATHLGLGLYVVRLIVERHQGRAEARNLDDGSGVAFTMRLRGMPRERLS